MRIKTFSRRRFFRFRRGGGKRSFKKTFLRLGFLAGSLVFFSLFLYGTFFLPDVKNAAQLQFAQSTVIYDRAALPKIQADPDADISEHILYTIHGDENRKFLPLDEIPDSVKKATIAIEDTRFYRHFGFDAIGLFNAVRGQLGLGARRGGSTITQQLVKNTFLSRERTFSRKFNEILLAIKVEWHYSKDEILELYLNNIPYGSNAHGIEAAAQTFFGKSARDLSLAESAVLASLPVAPTRFSPYGSNRDLLMGFYEFADFDPEKDSQNPSAKIYKKGRKDLVLQRMLDEKFITFDEFKVAFAESKNLEFRRNRTDIRAPHFVFFVREILEEKFGNDFLRDGGLKVFTTLDPQLQSASEKIIAEKSAPYPTTFEAQNVAALLINPSNGEILSYVGGRDYFDTENDGQVDILRARRQPGSSFKPFTYAAAFEKGFSPATIVFDVETDFGGNYTPQNFDGTFAGPVSLRESLNRSLNIPAVKTAYLARPEKVFSLAENLDIKIEGTPEQHGVAIGIGVGEVEPLSLISAYQTFAGNGDFFVPKAIAEIRDSEGKILESSRVAEPKKGLDAEVAALVRNILTDESTRPTTDDFDWNKLLQLEKFNNGSKTGTSNRRIENPDFDEEKEEDEDENPRTIIAPGDSWTIGFTPHLVGGVWVGNNRGDPMKPGATGLAVAAPIWKRIMNEAHEILDADPEQVYDEPVPLESREINKFSGKLATELTPPKLKKTEFFASFSVPTQLDDSVKIRDVDKLSGRIASPSTPIYSRTQKYALDLQSIRPQMENWQNPVEEWLDEHPQFLTSLGQITTRVEKNEAFQNPTRIIRRADGENFSRSPFATPPKISIISPKNRGTIARGRVEVPVQVSSKSGIAGVEFYFDDALVATAESAPFLGTFSVPVSAKFGSEAVLRAVAIDRNGASAQSEIKVKIAPDQQGPEITFLGPVGRQRIPSGTQMQILAEVRDAESAVKVVEFLLDDQSLGFSTQRPFSAFFTAAGDLGTHKITIRAHDNHGNLSEKTQPVIFEREKISSKYTSPEISEIIHYRNSVSVDAIFPSPENIKWAEIRAEQKDAVIFSEKVSSPLPKSLQLQIPKNAGGKTKIQLFYQRADGEKVESGRANFADF